MKVRKIIESFNYAISGLIYTLKTQRNMRIHFTIGLLVILTSLFMDLSRVEIIILFFTICLVIISEMINTAIEATIDLYTSTYHPLAKIAKNVAAGAVLVSAINSVIVAYVLFFDKFSPMTKNVIHKVQQSPGHLTFVSLILVVAAVIAIKSRFSEGSYMVGGMPSGHSAISFSLATAITFITENMLVATLAYLLAFLVSQSRIEGKIHDFYEVIVGSILGLLVTILIFQLIY
ncbi:diacylglycerol kinase [Irregularibacter muris]|uniref:Diacylglycerol kinase n=1 Tax=Irregularibacter muris TaxID=1796619 RepID=A0AAE3HCV6_9FIRM|nr:diacylglycerol kinase [Irregularibacter muris]MCR1897861.1 diacylglycerol kinase [Irregularibacter muris]